MNPITALTKRFFNTPTQTGNNKLATLLDVNNVINELPVNYLVAASAGKLALEPNQNNIRTKNISVVTHTTFGEQATNALIAGKKLDIAVVDAGRLGFNITSINVSIGTYTDAWDGGDLEFYLGDSLVGKITAAELTTALNAAVTYKLALATTNIRLVTGTFKLDEGIVTGTTNTVNVRLSAATTNFKGLISIMTNTDFKQDTCGTYCPSTGCNYNLKTAQLYCSVIAGKCATCFTKSLGAGQVADV